jgi:hypothetical protein
MRVKKNWPPEEKKQTEAPVAIWGSIVAEYNNT